jgi:hypothetical protein
MISTIKSLFKKKRPEETINSLGEIGSAIKEFENSGVRGSKKTEDWIGYFGSTGSAGHKNFGPTGLHGSYKINDEIRISPFNYEPELAPKGSYPDCSTVMFHTHEWIKRDYLKPIGRSRVTGETIYKYTGFNPNKDLNNIGIDYNELI